MTPAPLSKVLRIVSAVTGEPDRARLLDRINGTLEMLYRTEALMWLYFKEDGCRIMQVFTENCRNEKTGPTRFLAVVLPSGVKNIRELNTDGWQYEITEERVEAYCWPTFSSPTPGRGCHPKAEHLPTRLLENDIPASGDSRIVSFRSTDKSDCGKLIGVRYIDLNNREQREDIELSTTPTSTSVSVGQFLEIVFPERNGEIVVETAEGFPLGRYHPSIMSPDHEWYRLSAGCDGMKVQFRGLKEPMPLVFDTDRVPFSDIPLWRLAIKAYENIDTMELTAAQNQGLARIYAQLAAVSAADLQASNLNFNTRLFPETSKSALSTARMFSRGNGRGYRGRYV